MTALKSPLKTRTLSADQAIAIAVSYLKKLPKSAGGFGRVRLEEIEEGKGAGRGKWMITISHTVPRDDEPPSNILAGLKFGRSYKVITIDSATRQVVSMKIRRL